MQPGGGFDRRIEAEIDRVNAEVGRVVASEQPLQFQREIRCHALGFSYAAADPQAFRIGPIDLAVPRGEITMIIGGNGSGKTTFLKVLAGLYQPTGGGISIDGVALERSNLQDYRELFSAIYTDFHLFRKLYGLAVEVEAVEDQLRHMGIGEKVRYGGDTFSTLDLSTRQRKRIAMVVALLEDRPVLIFDEWAADQDPDFRRYFYEALLPRAQEPWQDLDRRHP